MFCSKCGHENQNDASFCSGCGKNISRKPTLLKAENNESDTSSQVASITNNADDFLSTFVGDKYNPYYREKWFKGGHASIKFEKGTNIYSFNLAGMLLGVFWLCYRKMYKLAFLMAILLPLLDIIMMHVKGEVGYNGIGDFIYGMIWLLTTGLLGNMLYHHYCVKKIQKIVTETEDSAFLEERLANKGGTTWVGAIVVGTLAVLTILLMYALFAPSWY